MSKTTILIGDALDRLRQLPDESVHCIVTSPPYWGLRDYGVAGQIGLEVSMQKYISRLVEVFQEARRVLRKDGTCWVNLGDSYNNVRPGARDPDRWPKQERNNHRVPKKLSRSLKQKDLCGTPWRVAFALQADGWYLRQEIIWAKPNPMPESVTDRCTKAHEYIFLLSKSQQYYYDYEAIKEPTITKDNSCRDRDSTRLNNTPGRTKMYGLKTNNYEMRNKRSVWTVATKPFKEAHFATFPPALIEPCIKAGCPQGGVVLDPFGGAGTTGLVANRLGRDAILIELNPDYAQMAAARIRREYADKLPMYAVVEVNQEGIGYEH